MVPIDENKFRPISFSNTSGKKEQDPALVRAEGNAHRNTRPWEVMMMSRGSEKTLSV